MTVPSDEVPRRLPLRYLPASYLESSPKLVGTFIAGAVYLFGPAVWPGAWAWLALGPLIAVLVCEPVWRWTFTRVALTPEHLVVTTGAFTRRQQSLAWADIGTVDSRQSWAFARWDLRVLTLSQAGDERTKVHLWAVDEDLHREVTARAGHALGTAEAEVTAEQTGPAPGILLYRVRLTHLLLASVVYGQFALIGGGAALGVSETLGMFGADAALTRWLPLPPAVWAVAIAVGIVALGLVLTVVRYASFEVRRMPGDRIVISYGLFSTHTRSVSRATTIGVVLQRNLVETLLGRVRLSLLTTDSAAQLGTNLLLPSLPRRVVERLLHEAFDEDPSTRLLTGDRGARAIGTGVVLLAGLIAAAVLAGWVAAWLGWPPLLVLATGAIVFAIAWPVTVVLCSRLRVDAGSNRVVLLVSHVVQRQTVLSAAAVHIVGTSRLAGHPLVADVCFYAGMPRTFRALRFRPAEVDALSARIAETVPLARTHRRAPAPSLT
ncbi:hypothetical protein [Microbacterium sp. LMI1x-1-1.1]|uniref:hypothetical protein n=1 Tax=Microbacterium sp. LMI1x-1-1.1 TaxID=3135246 RepID=UPI003448F024